MSAISNAGTSSSLLYLGVQSGGIEFGSNPPSDPTVGADTAADGSSGTTTPGAIGASPLTDLRSLIESAVTTAVNQLPPDSSPQDIFQAIRSAVEDALKASGLDPSQLIGHHGGHHHHQAEGIPADDSSADNSAATSTDPDGDGDTNQQTSTDPLLALLEATAGNLAAPQSLPGDASTGGSGVATVPSGPGVIGLFATGPNAAEALTSLVQQLSASGNTPAGQGGNSSAPTNSLLAVLQGVSAGGLDLTGVFQALFQNFPNGSGLDVQV